MQETLYKASIVEEQLGLNGSTLRKYATLLESFNYPIRRNKRNQRLYTIQDIEVIEEFLSLLDKGWKLVKAAECVTGEYKSLSTEHTLELILERLEKEEHKATSIEQTLEIILERLEKLEK